MRIACRLPWGRWSIQPSVPPSHARRVIRAAARLSQPVSQGLHLTYLEDPIGGAAYLVDTARYKVAATVEARHAAYLYRGPIPPPDADEVAAAREVLRYSDLGAADPGAAGPPPEPRALHAPVLHVPDVLDPELCQRLIRAHREGRSGPGTCTGLLNGKPARIVDLAHKRRRDLVLTGELKEAVWARVAEKIRPALRQAFHFDICHYEYIQIGCYSAQDAGHFSAHRDNTSALSAHRRFAMTINLSDGYEGGSLRFPEFGDAEYRPAPGGAIVFSCSLLHEALPVNKGERYMVVGMFFGEAEVPLFREAQRMEAASSGTPALPPLQPTGDRGGQLCDDARLLREIAGDVQALGPHLVRVPRAAERLDGVHGELLQLRNELRAQRRGYLEDQLRRLVLQPPLKLHLGCGAHRLAGWCNIDASGGDLTMDLRWAFPFPDGSAKYAFASHVLEHLYRSTELPALLRQVFRVLEPGGVLRVAVPDIEQCLRAYVAGDAQFFEERKKTWSWAASCRTRLDHFLTYAGANQALEGFDGHKYGFDFETLALALREAGFRDVVRSSFMKSDHQALRVDDASHNATAKSGETYYSLFAEATKS